MLLRFVGLVIPPSSFLLPFAQLVYDDQLHRYYGSSDSRRLLHPAHTSASDSFPSGRVTLPGGLDLLGSDPHSCFLDGRCPHPVSNGSPCLKRLNFQPFRLQPPHCHFSTIDLSRYIIVMDPTNSRFRVRHLLAGSPTGLAETSSLSLRTGLSSQVALHLALRQRSYH